MARRQPRPSPGDGARGPRRRCLVTGRVGDKDSMVRFVVGPEGQVVPDIEGRLPGRGLWLSAGRDMVCKAGAGNLFAKAARTRAVAPGDLAERVEGLLARRCLELIGLARRCGQATAGFERVGASLRAGPAGVLLAASDGAPAGRAKLRALAPEVPLVELLSGDELGAAVGRLRAVHLVLSPGRLADRLLHESSRLAGFRRPAE